MVQRQKILFILAFCIVILLYILSVFYTFRPRGGVGIIDLVALGFTLVGGLGVFGLGYLFTVYVGGHASLGIVDFTSKIGGSKHAIEIKAEPEQQTRGLRGYASLFYTPALILLISLAIAVNIHYLEATFSVTFQSIPLPIIQNILSALDIFTKPTSLGSLRYSLEIIPIMVFFIAIGGLVPSLIFPYLRKFRVSSFNGVPFHKNIVYSVVGAVLGLTIILSMVNIIYGVLIGTQPHYYSYLLPTLLGFSLHFFLGAYLAREKAEAQIIKNLKSTCLENVFEGKLVIQKRDQ